MKKVFAFSGGVLVLIFMGLAMGRYAYFQMNQPAEATQQQNEDTVACAADAKQCPDGSYVGRTGPDCEFAPCPATGERLTIRYGEDTTKVEEYRNDCQQKQGEFNECASTCIAAAVACADICSMTCDVPANVIPDVSDSADSNNSGADEPVTSEPPPPAESPDSDQLTQCDPDDRPEVCPQIYSPVCGDSTQETYGNGCVACSNEDVMAYSEGACSGDEPQMQ